MDRDRFSWLAHNGLDYSGPFTQATFERVIDVVAPHGVGPALDIGCGKAEFLIQLAELCSVHGVGIERAERMASDATRRVRERGVAKLVAVRCADAAIVLPELDEASFEVVASIGSTHALGGGDVLPKLARLVRPGGHIVWGEGYWKRPPSESYLARLGGSAAECGTHASNIARGVALGLVPRLALTASKREWDEYEWAYCRNIEDFIDGHPDDPDAAAMLERIRSWRDLVLDEGRETLGFGLYVFRR